jgi:DNA repair photolyase
MPARQPSLFPTEPTLREVADLVRLSGLDGLPEAIGRADEARYQEVTVKSALTEVRGMPFRWALNPYRGCTHACQYCYARKYQRHLELGAGDDFSSVILVKVNLPERLRRDLGRAAWTRDLVAVGTATDPYQPIEGRYRITRRCLEALVDSATPFSVVTKGPMVVRDLDVLVGAAGGCQVYISVPSVDAEACAKLEPGTAPAEQRLRAATRLANAGVRVGVLMMPLVPGITTARGSLTRTMEAIRAAGVPLVGASVARLDQGVREFFLEFVAREYPALAAGYGRLYAGSRAPASYLDAVRSNVARVKAEVLEGA